MSADYLTDSIQIESKETAPCTREAAVTVSASGVEKTFNDIVKEVSRDVQIQGFRKGKVPAAIVKARFASNIQEDAARRIQNAAIEKAQKEQDLVAVVSLDDKKAKPEAGKDYSFQFVYEIAPSFELPDYSKLTVEVKKGDSVEKLVADRLANLKDVYADDVKVETPSQKEDMLKVSYESDFAPAEDASPSLKRMAKCDEAWVWLHEPEYVPGANAALTGKKAGETVEFTAVFPADWRETGLAGKTVKYTMKINDVQRRQPIEDEAKLAEKLHVESVEKLHENLKKSAESQIENTRRSAASEKVMDLLLEKAGEFALPKSIVDNETERAFSRIANQLVRSKEDVEKFKADREKHLADAKAEAEKTLRRFFVIRKVAEAEKIEVSKNEFDAQIKNMSAYYGYKEKDLVKMIQRNGAVGDIHSDLLTGKVLDFIVKKAEIKEV